MNAMHIKHGHFTQQNIRWRTNRSQCEFYYIAYNCPDC